MVVKKKIKKVKERLMVALKSTETKKT